MAKPCVGEPEDIRCGEPARYRAIVATPQGRRVAVLCERCCALLRAEGAKDPDGGLIAVESVTTLRAAS